MSRLAAAGVAEQFSETGKAIAQSNTCARSGKAAGWPVATGHLWRADDAVDLGQHGEPIPTSFG